MRSGRGECPPDDGSVPPSRQYLTKCASLAVTGPMYLLHLARSGFVDSDMVKL